MKRPAFSSKKKGKKHTSNLMIGVVAAVALAVITFAVFSKTRVPVGVSIGERSPDVTVNDLTGKSVVIPPDLKGKVVFLHFWLSSCSYCAKEMYALESFYRKHEADGVSVLSINAGEDRKSASRYVSDLKISYPILLDPNLSTTTRYGVSGVPTTYVLDRQGVVRFKILGEMTADKIDEAARALLVR